MIFEVSRGITENLVVNNKDKKVFVSELSVL